MYYYRTLTPEQRNEVVAYRRQQRRPWHSPPHWNFEGERQFFISGACFEHAHIIGANHKRMTECENDLLEARRNYASVVYAWCILPNHYHILVKTVRHKELRKEIGRFHGRSSFKWNGEDRRRGRQVWHNCFDRAIKSYRHFWATVNYIHNNPVHHGHVDKWQNWPWSGPQIS